MTCHKRLNWAGTSNAALTAEREQSLPSTGPLGDSSFRRLVDRLAPLYAQLGSHATFATLVADATPSAVMHAMPGAADRLAVRDESAAQFLAALPEHDLYALAGPVDPVLAGSYGATDGPPGLIRSEMSEKSSSGMVKSPRRNGSPQWLGSLTKES